MSQSSYDLVVIGSGPAGQKGALNAAKLGKRVAIVERCSYLGGAQINTGTIPSKALREAVLHLTGAGQRGLFGQSYRVKRNITIAEISSDKTYTVPDIQATAIRLKDSKILGQASSRDVLGKDRYAGNIARNFDVQDIAEATALALMEDMAAK